MAATTTGPTALASITATRRGKRRIVAFRNILIHGYADVDNRLVWDVAEAKLHILRCDVEALMQEAGIGPD